jgi:hypothetical protein
MTLLEQIDKLRAEVHVLIDCKRAQHGIFPETFTAIAAKETEIDALILRRDALPACPYPPCTGRLEPTPTKHVLKCTRCAAMALPGRMEAVPCGK